MARNLKKSMYREEKSLYNTLKGKDFDFYTNGKALSFIKSYLLAPEADLAPFSRAGPCMMPIEAVVSGKRLVGGTHLSPLLLLST